MSRIPKILSLIVAALAAAAFQIGAIAYLPRPFSLFAIPVAVMVFLAIARQTSALFWFAFVAGIALESASRAPFGAMLISLLGTATLLEFATRMIVTTHTIYALLASTAIGVAGFTLIYGAFSFVRDILGGNAPDALFSAQDFFLSLFVNVAAIGIIQMIRASRRFLIRHA